MKRKQITWLRIALPILVILSSTALMLYPFISNFLFEHRADSQISIYERQAQQLDTSQLDTLWTAADAYNAALLRNHIQLTDPFEAVEQKMNTSDYLSLLSVDASGIMTYIEIPKIGVYLPVYHGTDAETLEKGVGHLEGSSLPVGKAGTHCILSGHTGLNRAKIFTDLPDLEIGDLFFLHTLGKTLAYQVDQMLVVEPDNISALQIESGKDYVTLVTCTPYGVNTHRLLVRGVRTAYEPEKMQHKIETQTEHTASSSQWMRAYENALLTGIGMVLVLSLLVMTWEKRRSRHEKS